MRGSKKPTDGVIPSAYVDHIIHFMAEGLIVLSPDGIIEAVNPAACALLGYDEKEIVGKPVGRREEESLLFEVTGDSTGKGTITNMEKTYRSKDGRSISVALSRSVVRDDGGNIRKIVYLVQDITRHKQAEDQMRHLVREILNAQESERERICLEVHDGLTQTLTSAFHYLQTLETNLVQGPVRQLALRASALVRQAIQECREVINNLQPATLRDLGLVAALRHDLQQLKEETGCRVDFKADQLRFPKDVEIGLYRIIREAITNVKKHADTKHLCISITMENGWVKVEVQDWGVGFNYEQAQKRKHTTGLLSMRKRAELLQGIFNIQSAPGQGTKVSIKIPLSSYNK